MKTPSPNRPRKRCSLIGQCSFRNEFSTEERIEILNTDINMPDIDGYALAKYAITRKFEGNHTVRTRERWSRLSTYPSAAHARRSEENNGTEHKWSLPSLLLTQMVRSQTVVHRGCIRAYAG